MLLSKSCPKSKKTILRVQSTTVMKRCLSIGVFLMISGHFNHCPTYFFEWILLNENYKSVEGNKKGNNLDILFYLIL